MSTDHDEQQAPAGPGGGPLPLSRRAVIRLGALGAAALGLAGCGDDDDASDATDAVGATESTAGGASATAASTASTDVTPATVAGTVPAERSGTLRYSLGLATAGWDPLKQTNSAQGITLFPIYDRLVHLSPEGAAIPGLAESWEFVDDAATLQFRLRPGVTFHDGTPFDATAVKANLERAKTQEGSVAMNDLAVIDTIEVLDDHTVDLHLTGPAASLPLVLSGSRRGDGQPGQVRRRRHRAGRDRRLHPGQLRAGRQDPLRGVGRRLLERRQHPHRGARDHRARRSEHGPERTQVRAARRHPGRPQPDRRRRGVRAGGRPPPSTFVDHFWMNRSEAPLSDVRVRQAINHAIDKEGLVTALSHGEDRPAYQMFPDDYFAASPDLGEAMYGYDVERAKELLADAGYPDGFDIEVCTVTLPSYVLLAEAVQAMLGDAGIRMTVRQLDVTDILDDFLQEKTNPAQVGSLTGRPDPSQTFTLLFTSTGFLNPGGQSTPEFEEKAGTALATLDPDDPRWRSRRPASS